MTWTWSDASSSPTASTAGGISVTANFAEGAVNRGAISGGYTAWEIAPNGPMGNINGCNGSSTWNFLEMGDSIYDGTHQGKGHLQVSETQLNSSSPSLTPTYRARAGIAGLVP